MPTTVERVDEPLASNSGDCSKVRFHELKTWPCYFGPVLDCRKHFEIRENDRDFKVGDLLHLREWIPETQEYTGRSLWAVITWMTTFAQQPGFVVMSIANAALERLIWLRE
jgi:hypothetical protein